MVKRYGWDPKVWVLIFLAIIIFPILLASYYSSSGVSAFEPSFDINASSITLIGTPGKNVGFNVTGSSLGSGGIGLWASDSGLNLELSNHSGFDQTFTVVGYVPENWGNNISCYSDSCTTTFSINANFQLPADLAGSADRTLSGRLTGDITTPQSTPDGSFQDSQQQVNIPVSLKLGIIRNSGLQEAREITLIGTLTELGLIAIGLPFLVKRRRARKAPAQRRPQATKQAYPPVRPSASSPVRPSASNGPAPGSRQPLPEAGDLLSCLFCGNHQKQVKALIAGPGVYICDGCVSRANSVIAAPGRTASTPIATIGQVSDKTGAERCSFCTKHRHQVTAMASDGDTRIICNECLQLCGEILSEELPGYVPDGPPLIPETASKEFTWEASPHPAHAATIPAGFQSYTNSDKSFSMAYPGDWQQAAAGPGTGSLFTSQDRQKEFQITAMNRGTSQADPAAVVSAACSSAGGTSGSTQTVSIGGQWWTRAECDHSDGINHLAALAVDHKGKLFFMIYASPKASFDSDVSQFYAPMEDSFQFL